MPGRSRISSVTPEVKRFGALEFRGGMVLTSPSDDFGGWSALVMDPAGKSMLAISDVGSWLSADLVYDGSRPSGLTNARLGPLLGKDGSRSRARSSRTRKRRCWPTAPCRTARC